MSSEPVLKEYMKARLANDFTLVEEWQGTDSYGFIVRIDFLAFPKPHLTNFPKQWFGIECKYRAEWGAGDANELWSQALTYTQCTYRVAQGLVAIPFCLVFTNLNLPYSPKRAVKPDNWHVLQSLLGRHHVGQLVFWQTETLNWEIEFGTGQYFYHSKQGRSHNNSGIALYAGNVGNKRGLITDYIQSRYYEGND